MTDTPITDLERDTLINTILSERRLPNATYRVQLTPEFTFESARAIIPYLRDLGITDFYASPLFRPRSGSTHGYDVVDYGELNPALGGEAQFAPLADAVRSGDMGFILDIVPNHMGIGSDNRYWNDVLEHGPASDSARWFDVSWQPTNRLLENKVLLPILEDHYGRVLEAGKLRLVYEQPHFAIYYHESRLPVAIRTCGLILRRCAEALAEDELHSIARALDHLPPLTDTSPAQRVIRRREEAVIERRLAALVEGSRTARETLHAVIGEINGTPDDPASFDRLDALLSQQSYYLAYWRAAADEINYRRFFDINDMVAINVQHADVFDQVHGLVFRLLAEGQITGLRIDHPDGLWNPPTYFRALQEGYLRTRLNHALEAAGYSRMEAGDLSNRLPQGEVMKGSWPLYVVAEKILSEIEPLPTDWAVYGTTGYDFLVAANNIFVDQDNAAAFDDLYSRFIGEKVDYGELIYRVKKQTMDLSLASEINARSQQLASIVQRTRRFRDFTLNSLTFALREIVACLPIYRTYISGPGTISDRDRQYLQQAVDHAKARNPRAPWAVFDFVLDTFLFDNLYDFDEPLRAPLVEFVMQFQQITGPVMAKSVEDTAFYIYHRLVSLNEVGGHPEQFGDSIENFHRHNQLHAHDWPHTILASSTHDTKRSEDVRARINVLSEIPRDWEQAITRWAAINAEARTQAGDQTWPDRNDEYLLYQTLIGAWPDDLSAIDDGEAAQTFIARIEAYMQKATNEAKVHTSWTMANAGYDRAVTDFIERSLANPAFVADFLSFQRPVAYFARFNSLSQTLLKLTSPGVPDIYQGTELWDYSLVDPDNRRPVDYDRHHGLLRDLLAWPDDQRADLAADLVSNAVDGRIKLYLIARVLNYRRDHRDLFENAGYLPLLTEGEKARHVCAFQRTGQDQLLMVIAPVLNASLTGFEMQPPTGRQVWGNTFLILPDDLPGALYVNVLTGESIPVSDHQGQIALADALARFPVALLERQITAPRTAR